MDLSNISINCQSSIRIGGSRVLYFDCFRIEQEAHDADVIFVTHEHFDHYDPSSIAKVTKADTILVAPESMRSKVLADGVLPEAQCMFCQPNTGYEAAGAVIQTIPAYNILKPFHPKHNHWLGYVVEMDGVTYYVAGDTDVTDDIRKVKCDVALLPVGGTFTMNKKKAAEFTLQLKPAAAVPTHYGDVAGSPEDGADFKALVAAGNPGIQVELKL